MTQEKDLLKIKKELQKQERQLLIRKFLHNRLALYGLAVFCLLLLIVLFAPLLAPEGPYAMDVNHRLSPPSAAHFFGTDNFGRDLWARVVYGARISMEIGSLVALLSLLIGTTLGLYSGYYRSLDNIIMRICDGISAVPGILLAIAFMAALGPSPKNVVFSLAMVYIPSVARIARSRVLEVKEATYIEAMRCLGASDTRIIWQHIAPNIMSPVIVQTSFVFAKAIITEAALSFLGVGVPAPTPSWGNILMDGKTLIFKAWWMIVFPSIITAVSVLGLNMLGDGLRDALDQNVK